MSELKTNVLYSGDILDTPCHLIPPYQSPSGRIAEWIQRLRDGSTEQERR